MKIPRSGFQSPQQARVVGQPARDQVNHIALTLHFAFHAHQVRAQQLAPLFFKNRTPYHDVDITGFVFERDEHHATGGAGALDRKSVV